jgi:hypothetical protein
MGGGGPQPAPDPSNLGIRRSRGATNQNARPVPCIIGRNRVGVQWISDPFNVSNQSVSSNGKGGGSSGYNWYSDIACLICGGPVDALYAIYFNGNIVYGKPSGALGGTFDPPNTAVLTRAANGPDSVEFNINPTLNGTTYNLGSARLYWGTQTQNPDTVLSGNTTHLLNDNAELIYDTSVPIMHPAYRGFCYIVFHNLSLGFNQTSFPNIEVVVGRYPSPDWLSDDAANVNSNNDANPICAIADWLQNPATGLNIPDSMLDIDGLNASAIQLTNEEFGLNPLLDREQPAKDQITEICGYFDGYPYINDDGTFGVGLFRVPPDGFDGLPTLTDSLFVKRPEFDADDWSTTVSETRVTFSNVLYDLTDDYVVYRNFGNRAVNNQIDQPATLERKWLAWKDFAALLAVAYGLRNSVPLKTGKVTLRRFAPGLDYFDLAVGTQFLINDTSRNLGNLIFRIVERTMADPAVPEFDIAFELDLSYLYPTVDEAQALVGAASADVSSPASNSPAALDAVRLVELPRALCPRGRISVAILAARNSQSQTSFNVWIGRNYEQGWPAA